MTACVTRHTLRGYFHGGYLVFICVPDTYFLCQSCVPDTKCYSVIVFLILPCFPGLGLLCYSHRNSSTAEFSVKFETASKAYFQELADAYFSVFFC